MTTLPSVKFNSYIVFFNFAAGARLVVAYVFVLYKLYENQFGKKCDLTFNI